MTRNGVHREDPWNKVQMTSWTGHRGQWTAPLPPPMGECSLTPRPTKKRAQKTKCFYFQDTKQVNQDIIVFFIPYYF